MTQLDGIFNPMIKENLSKLNSEINSAIKSHGFDPYKDVASGSETILHIPLADTVASYSLTNLTGISTFFIETLEISDTETKNSDHSTMHGHVNLSAHFESDIKIHIEGELTEKTPLISPHIGMGGEVIISGVSIRANGDYEASKGSELCLKSINIKNSDLNYVNLEVNINDLGDFNKVLHLVEDYFLNLVKGPIINLIKNSVTAPLNKTINDFLPVCQK